MRYVNLTRMRRPLSSYRAPFRQKELQAEIKSVAAKQKRAKFHSVSGTIIASLVKCLEAQNLPSYQAAVAGELVKTLLVQHFRQCAFWCEYTF